MPAQTATTGARELAADGRRAPQGGSKGKPKRPKRSRAPLWAKLVTIAGTVLTLVSAGGLVAVQYFSDKLLLVLSHT